MPTFRSDSSAHTNLTVEFTQLGRGSGSVKYRCDWTVTTGSETANGAGANNYRDLSIYWDTGVELAKHRIKATSESWRSSSKYQGSFEFEVGPNVITTANPGNFGAYIRTNATGTQSCIWTQYCTNFSISYGEYWSGASAPYNLSMGPNPFENTVNFSWKPATAGINNAITEYRLYIKVDEAEQQVYAGSATSYQMNASGIERGKRLRANVVAITQRGDNPACGWSNTIMRNNVPNTPTSLTLERTSYIPGQTIRIYFANNGDPNGNLAGFEVATNVNTQIVGSNASAGATYVNVDTTGWEQGTKRKFRVRAYDALGAKSNWSNYTAEVTLNTAPLPPSIEYPAKGSTVYSRRPRVLLKAAQTNDGPKHILCVGEQSTQQDITCFSCGINDNLQGGQQVIYRPVQEQAAGSFAVQAAMDDSFLSSEVVSQNFQIEELSFTDANLALPGTKIKAAHITELQSKVNALRIAYGLQEKSFSPVLAGVTKIGNPAVIAELQQGLQEVIGRINEWDDGKFGMSISWINPSAQNGGVERTKLRQAIEQLRTAVAEV